MYSCKELGQMGGPRTGLLLSHSWRVRDTPVGRLAGWRVPIQAESALLHGTKQSMS